VAKYNEEQQYLTPEDLTMPRKAEPTYITEKYPFAKKLKWLMNERGTTQPQLAEYVGVTRQAISLYVTGQSAPDIYTAQKIAEYFDCSMDYLLGLDSSRNKKAFDNLSQGLADLADLLNETKEPEIALSSLVWILLAPYCLSDDYKEAETSKKVLPDDILTKCFTMITGSMADTSRNTVHILENTNPISASAFSDFVRFFDISARMSGSSLSLFFSYLMGKVYERAISSVSSKDDESIIRNSYLSFMEHIDIKKAGFDMKSAFKEIDKESYQEYLANKRKAGDTNADT